LIIAGGPALVANAFLLAAFHTGYVAYIAAVVTLIAAHSCHTGKGVSKECDD